MKRISTLLSVAFTLIFFNCDNAPAGLQPLSAENLEKTLMEKLINAQDGELVLLPEGTFSFKRPLSLGLSHFLRNLKLKFAIRTKPADRALLKE